MQAFAYRCAVCRKLTAGRKPRGGGDGTFFYPRRHPGPDGKPCAGNIEEAEWVEIEPTPPPSGSIRSLFGKRVRLLVECTNRKGERFIAGEVLRVVRTWRDTVRLECDAGDRRIGIAGVPRKHVVLEDDAGGS